MNFAEFIAPFDAAKFRAEYYGKRPVHIAASENSRARVLNWERFNDVLAIEPYWNENTLKLYFKSRPSPRENYCDTADPEIVPAPANAARVKTLLGLGASLVANKVHRVSPDVRAVADMLAQEFAARVGANVYCSFKGVQAFRTHFDLHDVFAVHLEGEKTWHVYQGRADAPVRTVPSGKDGEQWMEDNRGPLLFEVVMRPGDILYLPRGQFHDALTGAHASLHVTFGVNPATGIDLFKLLEDASMWESEFRAYLPDARSEAELRQHLARLAKRLGTVMTSQGFAVDVLNHQRELAAAATDYGLPMQRKPSWYAVARPSQRIRRDAGIVVVAGGWEIALGPTAAAIEWALNQRYFSLEDAASRYPGTRLDELRAVIRELIAAGIVSETEMQT